MITPSFVKDTKQQELFYIVGIKVGTTNLGIFCRTVWEYLVMDKHTVIYVYCLCMLPHTFLMCVCRHMGESYDYREEKENSR